MNLAIREQRVITSYVKVESSIAPTATTLLPVTLSILLTLLTLQRTVDMLPILILAFAAGSTGHTSAAMLLLLLCLREIVFAAACAVEE